MRLLRARRPRTHGPPAAAKRPLPPDGGGGLTLDEVRPPLRKALKLTAPRSKQPTIGGGLNRRRPESEFGSSAQAELQASDSD